MKKTEVSEARCQELVALGIFVGMIVLWFFLSSHIKDAEQAETIRIKPRMIELAEQGNIEAIRWSFTHDFSDLKDWAALNKRLAELGDPRSMYYHGYRLEAKGDIASAYEWYEKSAAKGFPQAMSVVTKKSAEVHASE